MQKKEKSIEFTDGELNLLEAIVMTYIVHQRDLIASLVSDNEDIASVRKEYAAEIDSAEAMFHRISHL